MNKINSSDDNDDVTATIINGELGPQLVLGSKNTGLDNTISVTATDTDGNTGLADTFTMTELTPAKNAIAYVDGVKIVSQSNDIDEAITGVSLSLTAADIDKTTTLTVSRDTTKTKTAIEGFVEAYNSVMSTIKSLSSYDPDTEQAGVLQGDSLPRSIQSQMRNMLTSQYSTSDGDKMLATLGITTTREGLLEIDSDKLTEVIASDTGAIAEMFSAEDTGLASKMSSYMDIYVKSGGLLESRDSSLDDQLSRLTDSRDALTARMEAYSDRLYAQYNAMDLVVASLNSTSSDLQSRLDSLPGLVNNN
jgi:flagellar hook-associated protein 2